jgi:hypothetical protein
VTIKYIFSINAGRSGSDYLTELLSKAVDTVSVHEGAPAMIGSPMQQFNEGDETALRALMPVKMKQIQNKSGRGKRIYCETNTSYIKGWGYLFPDQYAPQDEIGVVILQRDVEKTAYSILRIHEVPGTSEWSRAWWLTPGARRNLSQPPKNANPYDLCKWYVEEVRLRAEEYKERFPYITYVECDLEQLNDRDFILEMFAILGLVPSPKLEDVVGKPLNLRNEWPRPSLEELLAPSPYPSADSLKEVEREALVAEMVAHLHNCRVREIATMEPNYSQGGTLFDAAIGVVARAEHELEEAFQYALKFTETEWVLILEFLHSVNPHDVWFVTALRSPPPGLVYRYDLNITPSIGIFVRRLGPLAILKALWMTAGHLFGRDYTHYTTQ